MNSWPVKRINLYSGYIKNKYQERVQKITVALPFTCPHGACIYCNNRAFAPTHIQHFELEKQIEHGITLAKKRYPKCRKYIIYFQNYTNTNAPLDKLKLLYRRALDFPGVVGLAIATRPDCIDEKLLELLSGFNKDITLEYGLESIYDDTLKLINRGHNYQTFLDTLYLTKKYPLKVCAHIILGLPLDTAYRIINTAKTISLLPIDFLKIHHLQILKDTPLADKDCKLFSLTDYLKTLAIFLSYLNPNIVIQRLFSEASPKVLIAPDWNHELNSIRTKLNTYMNEHHLRQGINFRHRGHLLT